MPLYEYVCPECGTPFERLVSFSQADAPQACPGCGHDKAVKKISRVAMHSAGGSDGGAAAASAAACSTSFG
jgi:putative FmdB family regulatory protein